MSIKPSFPDDGADDFEFVEKGPIEKRPAWIFFGIVVVFSVAVLLLIKTCAPQITLPAG